MRGGLLGRLLGLLGGGRASSAAALEPVALGRDGGSSSGC